MAVFRAGHVVGGRIFGYRNHHVYVGEDRHGNPKKSHTERVIEPVEAAVVRHIFERYDSGYGLNRICRLLRNEGAAFPKPFDRKKDVPPVGGWSPSTIRAVLSRSLYRGEAVWNTTKKRNPVWYNWAPHARPESEHERVAVPHLRIIEEPLWRRVKARRKQVEGRPLRFADGRMLGRPPKHDTQNLLAGLATYGVCGGSLVVETGGKKRGRKPEYICHRRTVGECSNTLRVLVSEMNEGRAIGC